MIYSFIYSVIYLSICQVAERALYFWNSEHLCVNVLSQSRANVFLPYVFGPLSDNARGHWNLTVEGLAQSVLKMYMEMDQTLYDRCARYVCTFVRVYVCTDVHAYVLLYLHFYRIVSYMSFLVPRLFHKFRSNIVLIIKISAVLIIVNFVFVFGICRAYFRLLIIIYLSLFTPNFSYLILHLSLFMSYVFNTYLFIFDFFEERILILHGLGMRKGKQQQINGQHSLQLLP